MYLDKLHQGQWVNLSIQLNCHLGAITSMFSVYLLIPQIYFLIGFCLTKQMLREFIFIIWNQKLFYYHRECRKFFRKKRHRKFSGSRRSLFPTGTGNFFRRCNQIFTNGTNRNSINPILLINFQLEPISIIFSRYVFSRCSSRE